ncbi:acyl-ACP thioesterase [Clostridium sp. 19966]|uniref:acyl-[acyl-carrier-protein] thioesterase n=1 Tax=Clostridium sp. 19966 TaxID=2768166 RepID=UPI0028DFE425|nr:acyl-ACP thioesterase domain-containing protein [Clostridium sp. 19966]MDT8718669.1 acyl-ACP thioesterase [Clostridium sp. 19966]
MGNVVTTKEYDIRYYEVDYKKRLFLKTMMEYFSDTSTYQSEKLGVGIDYLKKNNLGWILYKWDIKIKEYPLYGETVKVSTEAYGINKFYAYRKFKIENQSGEVIVEADSIWLLLDIERRRPVRVNEEMFKAYGVEGNGVKTIDIENIAEITEVDGEKFFNVRYSDIDTNRHVNNVKYVEWALEVVPTDVMINRKLNRIKITYNKETTYGETVKAKIQKVESEENGIKYLHAIEDSEGKELTRIETVWE